VVVFFIAAALSLVPDLASAAGMMTMTGVVIFIGLAILEAGLSRGELRQFAWASLYWAGSSQQAQSWQLMH
jgi:hypothetical protein